MLLLMIILLFMVASLIGRLHSIEDEIKEMNTQLRKANDERR